MIAIAFLTWALSMGLLVCLAESQSPLRPSCSNSLERWDLVLDKLPGAAISSPSAAVDPAGLGSQGCMK